jgi:cell division ATPase FtsA
VGTETVKSLLFEERGQEIKILGSSLEYFDRYGIFDTRDFETDVLKKAISRAVQNLGEEMNKSVILGLPAHILKARVIRQSLKREEPKKIIIDEKEEKEIFQKVLEKAKRNICQIYSEQSGILPEDIQFINLKILEIKIDGYRVPAIQKYEGKTLDFIILATFLPKHYLKKIKNIIESLGLTIKAVIQNAQGLNLYIDKTTDKIFLDIGGTVTQIFLVKGGVLEKIDEFPIGGQIFSKAISEKLGLTEAEARILKERYSKKELSKESSKRIKEIIWFPSQVWFRNLKLKLKEMTARHSLPLNIILFGGGSQLPDVQDILKKGEWESVSSGGKFEVQIFCPVEEDKSSSPPFVAARVKEKILEGIKILNTPQEISLLLMSYLSVSEGWR